MYLIMFVWASPLLLKFSHFSLLLQRKAAKKKGIVSSYTHLRLVFSNITCLVLGTHLYDWIKALVALWTFLSKLYNLIVFSSNFSFLFSNALANAFTVILGSKCPLEFPFLNVVFMYLPAYIPPAIGHNAKVVFLFLKIHLLHFHKRLLMLL